MARVPLSSRDPARDAAALLRRLGFAVLTLGVPVMSLVSRRGVVLMLPIGAALLVLAASLDRGARNLAESADRLASSPGLVAMIFGLAWMVLSLAWSPDAAVAAVRLGGLFGTLGLALAAYLALPERTRVANMYLAPVGVAVAAVVAIGLSIVTQPLSDFDEDGRSLGRGVSVLILFVWPAIAWLRSRDRDVEAACLTILVAVAAVLGPGVAPPVALIVGCLAFALTYLSARLGVAITGGLVITGLALAPALPFLPAGLLSTFGVPAGAWQRDLGGWAAIVRLDPWRLLTGAGFDTLFRARLAGVVPANAPVTPLVQVWYEFGLVGALSAALAIWMALKGANVSYPRLLPGIVAGIAAACTLAGMGIGAGQAWWPGALAILGFLFVGAERGQYRTRRPRARDIAAGAPA